MFEIGNSLREARVRQGLEYPQIELATKVRAKYLRALEDEEFAMLPAQAYVKGFLRTYAEFLGLDGQLYVDEYNSRFVSDALHDVPLRRVSPRVRQERNVERKVLLLALAGIAVLTALVIVAWNYGGGGGSGTPPAVTKQQTMPPPAPELRLTGVGRGTYVEVRRSSQRGALLLRGTVPRGKVEVINGNRFWLYVRRPAGIRMTVAGKVVTLPSGKNLRLIVTPTRTARAGT
jgi:hypothetical protein